MSFATVLPDRCAAAPGAHVRDQKISSPKSKNYVSMNSEIYPAAKIKLAVSSQDNSFRMITTGTSG
jgi:hypothetical protein